MVREFSFNDDNLIILSPLPNNTMEELVSEIEAQGFNIIGDYNPDEAIFTQEYQHSAGAEVQFLTIEPGFKKSYPRARALDIYNSQREFGIVLLSEGDDEKAAALRGLEEARKFYTNMGQTEKMRAKRALGNLKEEDTLNDPDRFIPYARNIAKTKFITAAS